MQDVRLVHHPEKAAAAGRLAEALESAGFAVTREAAAEAGAVLETATRSADAAVVVLVWSRALVSAALLGGGVAAIRKQPNLIEVSTDGIEPAGAGDPSPVVSLSGWRGNEYHPGWQRLLSEIGRRCQPGAARVAGPAAVAPGSGTGAKPAARSGRRVGAGAAVAALLGLAAGAAVLMHSGREAAEPPSGKQAAAALRAAPERRPAAAAVPPPAALEEQAALEAAAPEPAGMAAAAAAAGAGLAQGPAPAAEPPAAKRPAAAPSTARPAAKARDRKGSGAKKAAARPRAPAKRYSPRYSKTMRLFCERSGRSTPQCRTYLRSRQAAD
jgi:hypothetical protein